GGGDGSRHSRRRDARRRARGGRRGRRDRGGEVAVRPGGARRGRARGPRPQRRDERGGTSTRAAVRRGCLRRPRRGADPAVRVALDTGAGSDPRGVGRYVRCLTEALHRTVPEGDALLEMQRPRGVDLFHAPRIEAALLRCAIPQVVTIHDLVILKRPGEYLRTGLRYRLKFLAASRVVRVIVPTHVVAGDVAQRLELDPARIAVVG